MLDKFLKQTHCCCWRRINTREDPCKRYIYYEICGILQTASASRRCCVALINQIKPLNFIKIYLLNHGLSNISDTQANRQKI